uniref:Mono-ADP ribosylhydrolase 2 n=1 Tax=Catagonus wagneri TaxID=51154 RepID=A0A8C3WQ00_9CETA
MSEFFPADDNEEEDIDMKEDSDENGPEEKQSVEEMEGQSQEADGASAAPVPSPSSEEAAEVCKDEDSAKDDSITKSNGVSDQDHPNGQENDSTKNEIKIDAESQSSYMETEELSSNQEDATMVDHPEVVPFTDDQEEKECEKAQEEDTTRVPVKSDGSGDTENSTSPDVEMNSQADSVNDPAESQQEDLIAGAPDEAKGQRNGSR